MKKRLRKKLRCGEFTEYGFEIVITFDPRISDLNKLMDSIIYLIESLGLFIGGSYSELGFTGFVTKGPRKTCTENDRQAFKLKLQNLPNIQSIFVGKLEDAWR
jgi:uncharacterized protein YggL (DUF469 family)